MQIIMKAAHCIANSDDYMEKIVLCCRKLSLSNSVVVIPEFFMISFK